MSKLYGPQQIANLPSIAWKNGGGTTRTLAVEPADAGLDDFLWRISLAEIASSGSFSSFAGVDRTIMLWGGDGVILRSTAWEEHALTTPWKPFSFRGEDDVECDLVGCGTTDLNLMARRGQVEAELRTCRSSTTFPAPIADVVFLCAQGEISIELHDRAPIMLHAQSFLRVSQVDADIAVVIGDINSVYISALLKNTVNKGDYSSLGDVADVRNHVVQEK